MARNLRDLRRKMKAIRSTRQVTKAMELVAASKMRRAVLCAERLRAYAGAASRILERIAEIHPGVHPYLSEKPLEKVLAILLTTNRGLCGSLNTQLFRVTLEYLAKLRELPSFKEISFVAVGKKGQQFLRRRELPVLAAFPALSNYPSFRDVLPIARLSSEQFLAGSFDHIVLLYMHFHSALRQDPTIRVLLPFTETDLRSLLRTLTSCSPQELQTTNYKLQTVHEYLFEPSQDEVLRTILPQLTEAQVYHAVLEASASEHSARMVAMRNATDNATDLLDDLTLTYNQTRQAGITAELSELSASKAALEIV